MPNDGVVDLYPRSLEIRDLLRDASPDSDQPPPKAARSRKAEPRSEAPLVASGPRAGAMAPPSLVNRRAGVLTGSRSGDSLSMNSYTPR